MNKSSKNQTTMYREGFLRFNPRNGRYALYGINIFTDRPVLLNDGFHCGDTMQVKMKSGQWKGTRIEMRENGSWYLVGVNTPDDLNGVRVRVTMRYITT